MTEYPTVLLLGQVVLLHPVGCKLVGRYSRKRRPVQGLDAEQEQQSRYVHVSQQHGVTSRPTGVTAPICAERPSYGRFEAACLYRFLHPSCSSSLFQNAPHLSHQPSRLLTVQRGCKLASGTLFCVFW